MRKRILTPIEIGINKFFKEALKSSTFISSDELAPSLREDEGGVTSVIPTAKLIKAWQKFVRKHDKPQGAASGKPRKAKKSSNSGRATQVTRKTRAAV